MNHTAHRPRARRELYRGRLAGSHACEVALDDLRHENDRAGDGDGDDVVALVHEVPLVRRV